LRNGRNTFFNFFNATNNPNLQCISVDDTNWANSNWANSINSQSYFSNNCSATGIEENELKRITVGPNPTSNNITINFSTTLMHTEILLVNAIGQVVFRKENNSSEPLNINLENSPGVYYLNIKNIEGKAYRSIKIIKTK
jgi:hypothetical protein